MKTFKNLNEMFEKVKVGCQRLKSLISLLLFIFFLIFSSNLAMGAGTGIWANTQCAENSPHGGPTIPCDFCDILIVGSNILKMLVNYALVIAGIMIVVGGVFILVSGAGGKKDLYSRGVKTVTMALVGAAVTLTSYIIVGTLFHVLTGRADFPWNKISCEHNPAYRDWQITRNQENIEETEDMYVKLGNDGIFACNTSTDYLKTVHPYKADPYQINVMKAKYNISQDTRICGVKGRDVLEEKLISAEQKYNKEAVYVKSGSDGEYCSLNSCSDISGPGVNLEAECYLTWGDENELKSRCKNFDKIKSSPNYRIGKPKK